MSKLIQLRQDRAAKVTAQKALIDARNADKRAFTEDEATNFHALTADIRAFDAQIELEQEVVNAQARAASLKGVNLPGGKKERGEGAEKKEIQKRASILTAIRNAKSGKALEGAEKELDDLGREANRLAGVSTNDNAAIVIPMATRADAQTVTLDSGNYGGNLVQDQNLRMLDTFSPRLFLEELGATVLTGLTGGSLPLINSEDFDFAWLAEGAEAAKQKKTFVGPKLEAYRASTSVGVSNKLIIQSSVAVEQMIRTKLMEGANRILNAAGINGAGGDAPTGILNTPGILTGSSTAAAAATHELLAQLEGLLDTADASSVSRGWLMHPKVKAALRVIKKDAGSGRFLLDSIEDLMGYKYVATNLIPTVDDGGTDVFPLIFGDFSQLYIGQWGAMSLIVDPYTNAGKGEIRLIPEMHAGAVAAKPTAFAVNSFITGI
jgi:HK97 family phage major capsid protein